MAIDEKEMREYLESFKQSLKSINANTSAIREGIGTIQEKVDSIKYTLGPHKDEGLPVVLSSIAGKLEKISEEINHIRFA